MLGGLGVEMEVMRVKIINFAILLKHTLVGFYLLK